MESVRLGSSVGLAKVFGTLFGVGGALVFIFYRGKEIHLWSTHVDLVSQPRDSSRDATTHHISILGALLVFGGNISISLWFLLQASLIFFSFLLHVYCHMCFCVLRHVVFFFWF